MPRKYSEERTKGHFGAFSSKFNFFYFQTVRLKKTGFHKLACILPLHCSASTILSWLPPPGKTAKHPVPERPGARGSIKIKTSRGRNSCVSLPVC
ncbi:hypothetical protein HMPREF3150_03203 [Pseudomonas aeruginosa]|nr:hypothetical protein HMPREF3150_03203 [Pseudomonas aeruginosa]